MHNPSCWFLWTTLKLSPIALWRVVPSYKPKKAFLKAALNGFSEQNRFEIVLFIWNVKQIWSESTLLCSLRERKLLDCLEVSTQYSHIIMSHKRSQRLSTSNPTLSSWSTVVFMKQFEFFLILRGDKLTWLTLQNWAKTEIICCSL